MITPLYFNEQSSRIFEADKAAVIRIIGLLIAIAFSIRALELHGGRIVRVIRNSAASAVTIVRSRSGLAAILIGVAVLALANVAATFLSVSPWVSV